MPNVSDPPYRAAEPVFWSVGARAPDAEAFAGLARRQHVRLRRRIGALIGLLAITTLASLTVGPGELGLPQILDLFAQALRGATDTSALPYVLIFDFRLPRLLVALVVGAGLGCSGALAQGIFRNPLAENGVLGIGNGAALAVVTGFALGLDQQAFWATSLLAASGSGLVLVLLFALAQGTRSSSRFLLAGVALNAVLGAATTCVLSVSLESWTVGQKAFAWLMGSFDARTWPHLSWCAPIVAIGVTLALSLTRALDALMLGEDTARSLGVSPGRVRLLGALAIALICGACTATVGSVAFVGLIVPHLARRFVGSRHRLVLPTSAILGSLLMLAVDTVSRAVTPIFLAPGALTSVLGGLFFLGLLLRKSSTSSRWLV